MGHAIYRTRTWVVAGIREFFSWDWQHSGSLCWHPPDPKPMKASAFTLARLTRDLIITIAMIIIRPTVITGTQMSIGGTEPIIATTTIPIPVGTTIRIDQASVKFGSAFFSFRLQSGGRRV
jgi:hypothetical protein